jgi:hypothetical protein
MLAPAQRSFSAIAVFLVFTANHRGFFPFFQNNISENTY